MKARLFQHADPVRNQQLEQEIQEMRPRMGELGMAFAGANAGAESVFQDTDTVQ